MEEINRCVYLDKKHNLSIKEEKIKNPDPDQVTVKIIANGICGSDVHFYRDGRLGNYFVTKPYIPGHECSGMIVGIGSSINKNRTGEFVAIEPGISCGKCFYCKIGRYNLCNRRIFLSAPPINGTLCDYINIRSDLAHKIPKRLDLKQASLVESDAVALHTINRSNFKIGKVEAILGVGTMNRILSLVRKHWR